MSTKLAKDIAKNSFTKQQALAQLAELRVVAQEHFFAGKDWSKDDESLSSGISKDDIDAAFSRAEEELRDTESVVVYTALELPEATAEQVGRTARVLFDAPILLDFKVDPALLGGAALSFRGQYKDYSLRARFEEKEKKEEIQKIYQKYLE